MDDEGAVLGGDIGRPVGRAVVDDDDLAAAAELLDRVSRFVDHGADCLFFVQAWQNDGDLHSRRKITALTAVDATSIRRFSRIGTAGARRRRAARTTATPRRIAVHLLGEASS
jgi:hypothetical protein